MQELQFSGEDGVTLHELISPCPPDAICAWSGIRTWDGVYERDGDTIVARWQTAAAQEVPEPLTLAWSDAPPHLVEQPPASTPCTYRRKPTKER